MGRQVADDRVDAAARAARGHVEREGVAVADDTTCGPTPRLSCRVTGSVQRSWCRPLVGADLEPGQAGVEGAPRRPPVTPVRAVVTVMVSQPVGPSVVLVLTVAVGLGAGDAAPSHVGGVLDVVGSRRSAAVDRVVHRIDELGQRGRRRPRREPSSWSRRSEVRSVRSPARRRPRRGRCR